MRTIFNLFLLIILITTISCGCPRLKPALNVLVMCSNPNSQKKFKCTTENNNSIERDITVGTIAEYKCDKYFKHSTRKGFEGGKLTCNANGTWTNQQAFQNFRCDFDCGKQPALKNELISQGNSTSSRNWPWVAALFRRTKDGEFKYICGGTLIGKRTVLTAAHCVMNEEMNKLPNNMFKVTLGTTSSNFKQNVEAGAQIFSVKEIHLHPDYLTDLLTADIAILVITTDAIFTDLVLPICLPSSYEQDALVIGAGNKGEVSSFGIDGTGQPAGVLQHAYILIAPDNKCHDVIEIIPNSGQFCAGNFTGPKICRGDSGSGLVFKSVEWNEEKYSIHGIVSSTGELMNGCAPFVIFTKVFSYISWIQEKLILIENFNLKLPVLGKRISSRPQVKQNRLYTRKERVALAKLRPLVNDILLEDYMHDDSYLIRFLREKKFNLKQTQQALHKTMEWRTTKRLSKIREEDFTQLRKEFPVFFQGYDKDGHPVFVVVIGLWDPSKLITPTDWEHYSRYWLRCYEEVEYQIRAVGMRNITQFTTIVDFYWPNKRKQLWPQTVTLWRQLLLDSINYYPRNIYLAYFINISPLVEELTQTLMSIMSENQTASFRVFGSNKTEWSSELRKQIPAEQLYTAYGGTKLIEKRRNFLQFTL